MAGYSGDGGPATQASLHGPWGITLDALGNIYFSDIGNQRIRKIDTSGIITTVAGNGIAGYNGDGIAAISASLNFPRGVLVDSAGNLYIADTFNNRVRKVTPSGTISTIAGTGISGYTGDGGPATAATLFIPQAVAINSSGKVFVADNGNGVIREVDTGGVITTFLQSPAVFSIGTMTFDTSDNLYFADQSGCVVQKVSPLGIVTTVAGIQSACGFNGDGPATSVNLNSPYGVAVGPEGSIYVGDAGNNRVRKVDTSGNLTTIAGNGICGFSGDGESALFAMLCFPSGIALGGGSIFVADSSNQRIRKIDNSGTITTIAGSGSVGLTWMTQLP